MIFARHFQKGAFFFRSGEKKERLCFENGDKSVALAGWTWVWITVPGEIDWGLFYGELCKYDVVYSTGIFFLQTRKEQNREMYHFSLSRVLNIGIFYVKMYGLLVAAYDNNMKGAEWIKRK